MGIRKFLVFFLSLFGQLISIDTWEQTHFVWNFGMIAECDVGAPKLPREYFSTHPTLNLKNYQNVKKGDIVWVSSYFITEFYNKVFPHIQVPFVLVVSESDASFPTDCLSKQAFEALLASENVMHIFAQNCTYQGPSGKVSHIPIGIDFHTVAYKGYNGGWGMRGSPREQEAFLLQVLQGSLPTHQRKCRVFADFQHADTMHGDFKRYLEFGEDRASIFKKILTSGVVDHSKWMKRPDLWKTKVNYAFSVSPPGNGIDAHRTWEDLILGCIVIVKTSPLDPIYEGLPVVIVQDWSEVNAENLQKWLAQYGDALTNPSYRERLTHHYWMQKIHPWAL